MEQPEKNPTPAPVPQFPEKWAETAKERVAQITGIAPFQIPEFNKLLSRVAEGLPLEVYNIPFNDLLRLLSTVAFLGECNNLMSKHYKDAQAGKMVHEKAEATLKDILAAIALDGNGAIRISPLSLSLVPKDYELKTAQHPGTGVLTIHLLKTPPKIGDKKPRGGLIL